MIPVTYCYPWIRPAAIDRRGVLGMLADNGIKRLTLTDKAIEDFINFPQHIHLCQKDLSDFHLDLMDAHAPWGTWKDPGMPIEDGHELIVLRQKMAIRICNIFGVTSMAFHTGNTFRSIFGDYDLDDYCNMLIRSLEELLPDAEKYNVVLCLENQWTPLNQSAYLLKVMEHFKSPYLGLCYDSGHAFLTQNGWKDPDNSTVPGVWKDLGIPVVWEDDLISKFHPWLVNCHLHDNNGFSDRHQLPGTGNIPDWPHIMEKITTAPRLQCIQSEVAISEEGIDLNILRQSFRNLSPELEA